MTASKWKGLSEDDREKRQDKAKAVGKANTKTISSDQKRKEKFTATNKHN